MARKAASDADFQKALRRFAADLAEPDDGPDITETLPEYQDFDEDDTDSTVVTIKA